MRLEAYAAAINVVVTTRNRLTTAAAIVSITAFVPDQSYARDDGRFANSPLKEWFDQRAKTDCAALLLMVSACRMSIGTRRMGTIVYDYTDNGSLSTDNGSLCLMMLL